MMFSVFESSDSGIAKAALRRQSTSVRIIVGVASLSILEGSFVLAKVRQGLISVCCLS